MFVPPFELLLAEIGLKPAGFSGQDRIAVPRPLLEFMLRLLLRHAAFNEANYLEKNPDVRAAIARGELRSGREHYVALGYFEGRIGGGPPVDETWYLRAYPDVAEAVRLGVVPSATAHYDTAGGQEWRVPDARLAPEVNAWRGALRRSAARPRRGASAANDR